MAAKSLAVILAISSILSGVQSQLELTQNHNEITVKQGDEASLICSANVEALGCTFRSPSEKPYNLLKGAVYEGGRIKQMETGNPNDCAMQVTDIRENDNGEWECSVTGKGPNGDFQIGQGKVQVIVAVPPVAVSLQMDGQPITGPIEMNLDEQQQAFIDCVATGARPAPTEFLWYIGNTLVDGNIKTREEEGENGKVTYFSTLEYNSAPKHSGQMIKCEVDHKGYTAMQIDDGSNIATAELNLKFKPENKAKTETFYGMKEGEPNTVRFKFTANPKPSSGVWTLGDKTVPVGASDTENTVQSSQITESGDIDGEYQVELTFTMDADLAGKPYSLEIENELGKTSYQFDLALDDQPPSGDSDTDSLGMQSLAGDEGSAPVIGIVILVVIIILVGGVVVIARAKGALCFAAKSGEPLEEEKEAFDDAEKGKLAPSNEVTNVQVTKTPEKKVEAETKPETEENKEEKKSNGAHTPV